MSSDTGTAEIVATFERTIQVRQYEPAKASVTIKATVPLGVDDADQADKNMELAAALVTQAKLVVFQQLGLEHTLEENGVVVELVQAAFDGATREAVPASSSTQAVLDQRVQLPAGTVSATPPHDPSARGAEGKANQAWAWERFAVAPSEFFDNRNDPQRGNRPEIKHKPSGVGAWS